MSQSSMPFRTRKAMSGWNLLPYVLTEQVSIMKINYPYVRFFLLWQEVHIAESKFHKKDVKPFFIMSFKPDFA